MRKVLFIILVTVLASCFGSVDSMAQLDGSGNAPDFTVRDIDGITHNLYEYLDAGKVVMIDFFAVWCGICQSNTSVLEDIYLKYGPEGDDSMELLSLEADNSTSDQDLITYIERFESSNPHVNETGEIGGLYNITGFPYYYVVAPDRSYKVFAGTTMNLNDVLSDAIESAPGLRDVENDIRIKGFTEPKGTYCNRAINPKIELQNYGKNDVTSFVINVEIDGATAYSQEYSNTLIPYQHLELTLPELENVQHGWHDFEISIASVNNTGDGDDNDILSGGSFLYLEESENIVIQVKTDTYPSETFWQVTEEGKIAAERLIFNKAKTRFSDTLCLEKDHCYTLNLGDRFGDGLSDGGFMVVYRGETIVDFDAASFSTGLEQIEFCLSTGTGINQDIINIYPDVFPSPASEEVNVVFPDIIIGPISFELRNVQGQLVYNEFNPGSLTKKTINISAFPDGIFFLRIAFEKCSITKKIFIKK